MATKTEIERLSVVETKVDTVIEEVKAMNTKFDGLVEKLDKKYAAKWVQTIVAGLVGAILLGFIAVIINFFIPNITHPTSSAGSTGTSQTAGSGGSSGTPSANASANAKSDSSKPSDSQNVVDRVVNQLPKVTN